MNELIEKLYGAIMSDSLQTFGGNDKETEEKEIELYHFIYTTLNDEAKKNFMAYVNTVGIRTCNIAKNPLRKVSSPPSV